MDGRIERVDDSDERDRLRAKARRVRMRALLFAAILTIATLFLR
jgi:hypothetical protein